MESLAAVEEVVGAHDWRGPESCERAYREAERSDGDERPDLVRDRDRIYHSMGLRVLQGKTQVFPSRWADPMRTRLTHTLEVAQIGRGIARRIGLPEELVEASCLAHDIGHPPFGHVGERALAEAMKDLGGFDANAQNVRLLTELEEMHATHPGLNLTRATLQSIVKYPYVRTAKARKDFLYEETLTERLRDRGTTFSEWLFDQTALPLGPGSGANRPPPRTLPCQVMDWADDAAYSVHDLEDAVHAGFITMEAIGTEAFAKTVTAEISSRLRGSAKHAGAIEVSFERVAEMLQTLHTDLHTAVISSRRVALRQVTRRYLNEFIVELEVARPRPEEGPYGYELLVPEEHRLRAEVLKSIVIEFVLKDERVARYLFKGRRMLLALFEELMADTGIIDDSAHQLLPRELRERLSGIDDIEALGRVACDYLSGMTENQLTLLYQTLFESSGGSPLR